MVGFSKEKLNYLFIFAFILTLHSIAYAMFDYRQLPCPPVTVIDTRSILEQLISARPMVSPSSSIATPVAYGVDWGTIFFGVAGQTGTQFTGRPFGQYAVGFGLGNADKYASLTTIIAFGGLDEVVRDGNVNFQLSRNILPDTAIAIGAENVFPWGADIRNQVNVYIVGSKLFILNPGEEYFVNIITSLGIGNSRFVHNYETHTVEVNKFRPFASIGIQVLPQAALMFDYVGFTYNAGISVVPFLSVPLVASLTIVDLTNRGGSRIPIAASLGYSYTF